MQLRRNLPYAMSCIATRFTVLLAIGEANPLRRQDDRRVHPDDLAARLTSGPPELPGLRAASVWMTSSISLPDRDRKGVPKRLHDAGGDRALKSQRIADCNGQLADANLLRIAKRGVREARSAHANHCQIAVRIISDQIRRRPKPVRQGHLDFIRVVYDVTVGQ